MSVAGTVLICVIAGIGAGFGTGIAGMSAAAVIAPMLISFLNVDPYQAIGIALASDVLASALSAFAYWKRGNIDVRNGRIMLVAVLAFTLLGSWLSSFVQLKTLGTFSMFVTVFLGVRFLVKPVTEARLSNTARSPKRAAIDSVVFGSMIGLICGFVGAGGGMMMLFVLTSILGYDLKKAVGTSVFIMTFTALLGAVSHFAIAGKAPDMMQLLLCIFVTAASAQVTAAFANRASIRTMNRALGAGLLVLGIVMLVMHYMGA